MADNAFVSGSPPSLIPSERKEDTRNTSVEWDFNDNHVAETIYEQTARSVVCITKHISWYDNALSKQVKGLYGTGSGLIWERDSERYIVTNYHVIKDASVIEVFLYKGNATYEAAVVAYDDVADIAVLSINAPKDDLIPIKIGVSAAMVVGNPVFAIGHNYYFTRGIVSHIGDDGTIFSQITVNRESSGAPLLDKDGNLIGVNKSLFTDPVTGFPTCFAKVSPVDTVSRILDGLHIGLPRA